MYTSTPSVTGESWPNCFMLKLCKKFGIDKTLLPTHLLRQQYAPPDHLLRQRSGEWWPSGRRQRRRAERNDFVDSETPRPPVDSSTRQEPEVLSTVESSTAGLDRPLGRALSLSYTI